MMCLMYEVRERVRPRRAARRRRDRDAALDQPQRWLARADAALRAAGEGVPRLPQGIKHLRSFGRSGGRSVVFFRFRYLSSL